MNTSGWSPRYVARDDVPQRGAPTRTKFGKPPFSSRRTLLRAGSSTASHLVRGRNAQQPQCIRKRHLRRAREMEPRLSKGSVVGNDAAVAVEGVEIGGELLCVARDAMRRSEPRSHLDD